MSDSEHNSPEQPESGQPPINQPPVNQPLFNPDGTTVTNTTVNVMLGVPENPWVEGLKTIALSAVLAFGIRTFVAEARYIPSGSMLPTLEINDRLIIDKVSYRLANPERGDIVVFDPTDELLKQNYKDAFIKRVIGLPGEIVEVRDGKVFVNGKMLDKEPYINDKPNYRWGPETVPQGQYLVLGDNRNNSYDSHFWGFVPKERIIGRAVVRFWPIGRMGGVPEAQY